MISPDYFSFRWSWYRPILNRHEQPAQRCAVDVHRLPIRMSGEDAREYIPYVIHPQVARTISTALHRLQDYAVRYEVRGEKISAHKLPNMDDKVRRMVAYLRKQNPHISRDLLHHWCADPEGANALLQVCEVMWEQGWKQDQADAAPWVPAINVLLLKLIREGIGKLSDEHIEKTNHVLLSVIGGLYVWALQRFLQRYLEGVVEVTRIATYESMMLPATPMAFLQYQPDASLLADDSRVIRAYGLEPEIVPRMRLLRSKVGMHNEGGMLQLLAKDQLGAHLQRRCWARLSLWKLGMDSNFSGWMRYVLDAKKLDQLLARQVLPDTAAIDNLKANQESPVAKWLLAWMQGDRTAKKTDEPWLEDNITLMAFRVFDEDVKIEVARRISEKSWLDRKDSLAAKEKSTPTGRSTNSMRSAGGLRSGGNVNSGKGSGGETDALLEKAWRDGDLVLIQPDVTKALHSGKALSQRQGCLRIEWSEYLAGLKAWHGLDAGPYITNTFLPGILSLIDARDGVFLDACSASGCNLRGSVLHLTETGIALRQQLKQWFASSSQQKIDDKLAVPAISMCMDMTGEWSFSEFKDPNIGQYRIAFSLAVTQAEAGLRRDSRIGQLIHERNSANNTSPLGSVNIEPVKTAEGHIIQVLHNAGFAFTAAAMTELTTLLAKKASIKSFRLNKSQVQGVLDEFRLPHGGLELLVIQQTASENDAPWMLLKAGKTNLGGVDIDVFELLDADSMVSKRIIERGLMHWK
ncbi:hypothetical protein D8Y20_02115 [Mariprofundus sp. EBB-1]|uniref:hypothetical protein n=1 Tax=Mariprofundus sp. EBB-1 TaxID=2650971 RepID=UPI000EF1967F|nr:hypothetical protein [Mariprofundus sp. EBB-1]RLL55012.1 hypothetical protein D8Y20_02115 [Mariprofundus sp. EBB-1]